MSHRALTLFAAVLVAPSAWSQSFNVDVGANTILFPAPSAGYGGAAGQPGMWNAVSSPYSTAGLVSIAGETTCVTIESDETSEFPWIFGPLTGDDANLMRDVQSIDVYQTEGATWIVRGLQPANYTVYTYAWAPDSAALMTEVDVVGSASGMQTVGGSWSGSPHVLGTTYAMHVVGAPYGVITIEADGVGGFGGDPGSVNGFQIVMGGQLPSGEYCVGAANSASPAGGRMTVSGVPSVGANDLVMCAAPVPNASGLFYYGQNQIAVLFGDGFRCIGGSVFRLPLTMASGNVISQQLDLTAPPNVAGQITPGSTWNFQAWFRDVPAGMSGFNLSSAFEVTFLP